MAIMGPSGSGKTTLLNVLARRKASEKAQVSALVLVNGKISSRCSLRRISTFVEGGDALIGSLTVEETLYFAAQFSLSRSVSAIERTQRINKLLQAFGLTNQTNTLIGTLLKKGISDGQKRRVSIASQLLSAPKVLFLDEPTSGLDSSESFQVMSYIRQVAKANNLIVVTSIHQPSTATLELFDKLLLLSDGKMCFSGSVPEVKPYFHSIGYEMPLRTSPGEFMLDLINADFNNCPARRAKIAHIQESWSSSPTARAERSLIRDIWRSGEGSIYRDGIEAHNASTITAIGILLHRSWIKSRRDTVVYGVRLAMYLGLAIMMGTIWLRLPPTQSSIQPFANCILFGTSFMSFMAVAYIPAFLEDRAVYIKDWSKGLYGSTAFIVSNFLIGLPYLLIIAIVPSAFAYWMMNLRPTAVAFTTWIMWIYLNLVAAESLVVLISSLFPHFVAALAVTACANGLWISCNGFGVALPLLNSFYRYVFYYSNYQAYVFRGLAVNEFGYRVYSCGDGCQCIYNTALKDQCMIDGVAVLESFGLDTKGEVKGVGIVLAIVLVLRLMGWVAMFSKRKKSYL